MDPITTAPCPGDGLVITGPAVLLDLGRSTLRGSLAGSSVGIFMPTGAVVRNGTIATFGTGISGGLDAGALVERVQVVDNADDGIALFGQSAGIVVRTSKARRNGRFGIAVGCGDIRHSHADQNGSHGIVLLSPACVGTVFHVVSRANGGSGFAVGGDGVRIDRSLAVRNLGHGHLMGGQDIIAERSQAFENGGHGFAVEAVFSAFFQVRTKGNAGFGIHDPPTPPFLPNFYGSDNVCQGDELGDSDPPGLCK